MSHSKEPITCNDPGCSCNPDPDLKAGRQAAGEIFSEALKESHSKEPWNQCGESITDYPCGATIAVCPKAEGMPHIANAARIVACVNFCAGVPDKLLSEMKSLEFQIRDEAAGWARWDKELEQLRAKLTEAESKRDEWKRIYNAQAEHHAAVEAKFEAALAEARAEVEAEKGLWRELVDGADEREVIENQSKQLTQTKAFLEACRMVIVKYNSFCPSGEYQARETEACLAGWHGRAVKAESELTETKAALHLRDRTIQDQNRRLESRVLEIDKLTSERDHFRQLAEDMTREKNEWKRIAGEREKQINQIRHLYQNGPTSDLHALLANDSLPDQNR